MNIFGVKDDYKKNGDIFTFCSDTSYNNISRKDLNSCKRSNFGAYYFTSRHKAELFKSSLLQKYKNKQKK